MAITFRITDAGWAAWTAAQGDGTNQIAISHVAFGDDGHVIDDGATTLISELSRVGAAGGQSPGNQQLHLTAIEDSALEYTIREIGLFLSSGELFAQWSDPAETAGLKAANAPYVLTIDLALDDIPDGGVVITETNISFPPATELIAGRIEIATQAEADAGVDDSRAMTPLKLHGVHATLIRRGLVELASNTETQAGVDGERAVTPLSLASLTATEIRAGLIEVATQIETDAGTDNQRAVTPQKLAGRTATEIRSGVIELATQAETNNGVDDQRAVTPQKLAGRTATETRAGVVELATEAEAIDGQDAERAVSPAVLASAIADAFARRRIYTYFISQI